MSAATKKKHVIKEMLEDFSLPKSNQAIVKVLRNQGSNLHEVELPDGQSFLASLPLKFRKNIWIKRGDFVITEPIDEGDKVKGEIVRILYPQHIKAIKHSKLWPEQFDSKRNAEEVLNETEQHDITEDASSSDDDFADVFVNTNRPIEEELSDSCESSDEDYV